MSLELHTITIEGCHKGMFTELFSIDSDFGENEEYFREDTLELGYNNEAERCSEELFNKHYDEDGWDGYSETLYEIVEEALNYSFNGTQFIAGNTTYTSEYKYKLNCIDDDHNVYELTIAMVTNH